MTSCLIKRRSKNTPDNLANESESMSSNSAMQNLTTLLFSIPFFAVGVFFSNMTLMMILEYNAMQSWPKADATILSSKIQESGDEGSKNLTATYEYTFSGTTYRGDRVGLVADADNFSSFHEEKFKLLDAHRSSGETFPCFVNPNKPSESILFPEIRLSILVFELMFSFVFGGAGLLMFIASARSLIRKRRLAVKQAELPEGPWLDREDWVLGEVQSIYNEDISAYFIVALILNLVVWPLVLFLILPIVLSGQYSLAIFFILPVVGIGAIVFYRRKRSQLRSHGASVLHLEEMPARVGGTLRGTVRSKVHNPIDNEFDVVLFCAQYIEEPTEEQIAIHKAQIEEDEDSENDHENAGHEDDEDEDDNSIVLVHWEKELVVKVDQMTFEPGPLAIPISIDIPHDAPQTDDEKEISWTLLVSSKSEESEFFADFNAPIFKV